MVERSAPTFQELFWTLDRNLCSLQNYNHKAAVVQSDWTKTSQSEPHVLVTVDSSRCADLFWLTCTLKNPPAATQSQGFLLLFFFTSRPHKFKKQKLYSGVQQPCFFIIIIYLCVFSRGHRLKGDALECLKHEHLQCRNLESVEPEATEFFSNTKRNIEWLWRRIKKRRSSCSFSLETFACQLFSMKMTQLGDAFRWY